MITTESFPRVFFSYPSSLESPGPATRPEKQGVSGITWFFGEKFVSKIIRSFPRVYSEPAGVKFASIVFFLTEKLANLFQGTFSQRRHNYCGHENHRIGSQGISYLQPYVADVAWPSHPTRKAGRVGYKKRIIGINSFSRLYLIFYTTWF